MSSHDAVYLQWVGESVSEDTLRTTGARLMRWSPGTGVAKKRIRMGPFVPLPSVDSCIQQTLVRPKVCTIVQEPDVNRTHFLPRGSSTDLWKR